MANNNNGSGATARSVFDEPVDYRDLKAWIAEQEANPRPLSPIQQRAIADLRRSFQPEIGDRDWVSLMNRHLQANGGIVTFTDCRTADDKFAYECHMKPNASFAEPLTFPNPEAGFITNETGALVAPGFGRKKDAKQYAAKSGIEWLMKGKYMPSDDINIEFPRGSKPTPTPAPNETETKTNPPKATTTGPNPTNNANTNNNPNPDNNPDNNDDDDDDDDDDDALEPATKRVEELCRLMGLTIPQYKTTASPKANAAAAAPNMAFFDGHADFGPDAIKVPDGLGRVSSVYGRKNVRERIAEEVLAWLVGEGERRVREVEEMMGQVEGDGGVELLGKGEGEGGK